MDGDLPQLGEPCAGAADALFTADPFIAKARALADRGRFAEARELLDTAPPQSSKLADELREILSRIDLAYQTDPEQLLAKIHTSAPSVTAADLSRWTLDGSVQFRTIDSKIRYFNREPANLFRFCPDAIARQTGQSPQSNHDLIAHLWKIIDEAGRSGDAILAPVDHHVQYSVALSSTAPGLKRGALVRAWLPFPQERAQQRAVKLLKTSPARYQLSPPTSPQRTIYFESPVGDDLPNFNVSFSFQSLARYPRLRPELATPLPAGFPSGWVAERPPHIRFTPRVLEAARDAVGDETNPLEKARRIFHYVVSKMSYAAEEEYGTIPSLTEKGLLTRRGDCGVLAMLFITLCRAAGVPARWQSGFQTRPGLEDMHDWAEFYVHPFGWLPADPSYGFDFSRDPAARADGRISDFYFGHLDSYRLVVNRDFGRQLLPRKSLLRSEPLDFQRGEIELAGSNLYFPNWSWDLQVQTNLLEQ